MPRVTVYDTDGIAHQKQPIDARECCDVMGWSMNEPSVKKETKPSPKLVVDVKKTPTPTPTKNAIKATKAKAPKSLLD